MAQAENFITKTIRDAIEAEVHKIAAEELEKAKASIEKRLREKLAQIVIATQQRYEVSTGQSELIIKVRNEAKL